MTSPPRSKSHGAVDLRISPAGSGALFLDAAAGSFDTSVQRRIWAVAKAAKALPGVRETVPGMNNLLVVFDALATDPAQIEDASRHLWTTLAGETIAGKSVDIPVIYGGARGEDLHAWARHCGLSVEEAVRRHAAAAYSVAAVGAMPGFPYLSGLDPRLAWGRRASPRLKLHEGDVIIGGEQAGIMPTTAPSGWHVLGHTALRLFDPGAAQPTLLQAGDTVRFSILSIEA